MADCSEETNKSLQADEVQALSAIYELDWVTENLVQNAYSIKISDGANNIVYFKVTLPESYPLDSPPIYELSAPWMNRIVKQNLCSALEDVYCQNIGRSIIYLWIEAIRNFINTDTVVDEDSIKLDDLNQSLVYDVESFSSDVKESAITFFEAPSIEHGQPIIDRKSVFQAHISRVVSVEQKLKENRKIATATHNIYAYRISCGDGKTFIQDCEDDGETKAGSGLLHLLQILDVSNILVVVSRWYGGVHLGPDRFKHINNAARTLLSETGLISEAQVTGIQKTHLNLRIWKMHHPLQKESNERCKNFINKSVVNYFVEC
ncbi:protein IMPACT isoform X2 [Parasteatoda tepidariorum]|uniref:protein IMPACT isoform X2 n=1 Tax=Parasteatoda tepidariorum TaxID=114398 RepID=UPI001C71C3C6|nr:protein IMPACT isoform X2 [Parasteatoda tepidariorum]